jgi:predicted transcriptional regulator
MPIVPPDAPVERITYLLSHESPAVFVQMEDGHYEILTKYDLMGTIAQLAAR